MNIITIDTGTTNSRLLLWQNGELSGKSSSSVGVRNTSIDGNNQALINAVSQCKQDLLNDNKLSDSDIDLILASGMVTSNLGLYEVPHLTAPVSVDMFVKGIVSHTISDISNNPIYFIPGVKNLDQPTQDQLGQMDIMRGEEVEAIAIADFYNLDEDALIALPGSHSKFVAMDKERSILGCCTTLTGELNSIITHNTILTNSLQNKFTDQLDQKSLISGADTARANGMGQALFSIRVREQFGRWQHHELASFLVGILIESDIQAMTGSTSLNYRPGMPVYVGGEGILCEATQILLKHRMPEVKIIACRDEKLKYLSAAGVIYLAKQAKLSE